MKNKLRVLVVISTLDKNGGAEKVAFYMSKIKGCKVEYVNFYKRDQEYKVNNPVYNLNESVSQSVFKNLIKIFTRAKKISEIAKEDGVDVCVGHMEESNIPLIVSKLVFGNRAKLVICLHNNLKVKHNWLYLFFLSFLYLWADKIIGVSRLIVNDLAFPFFLKKKYQVIYNPVDLDLIKRRMSEESFEIDRKALSIVTVGRLHPQKNHKLFLRIMSNLDDHYKGYIIGEGSLRQEMEGEIAKNNLNNKVTLLGFQDNVFKFLKKSRLLVVTSKYEGFGLSIVEAMACGIPVISMDCPYGPREIITGSHKEARGEIVYSNYGVLIRSETEDLFVKAIRSIVEDSAKYDFYSKQALERAQDFSVDKFKSRWRMLLRSMI